MNLRTLLLAIAVICFAIDAFGLPHGRINLQSLGLACGFGSMLV